MSQDKVVTLKDVEHVALLARLEFNEEEKEKFAEELNKILLYVKKLSEIDTEGVDISISPYKVYNALREDEVIPSMDREDILMNAPEKEVGYIRVPTIIE